jgi:hypothetical protein
MKINRWTLHNLDSLDDAELYIDKVNCINLKIFPPKDECKYNTFRFRYNTWKKNMFIDVKIIDDNNLQDVVWLVNRIMKYKKKYLNIQEKWSFVTGEYTTDEVMCMIHEII